MDRAKHAHKLYHEAQKRAAQPQQVLKHCSKNSLLLAAPNNIIFELFNTIIKEVSADRLLDFLLKNLKDYFRTNWNNKIVQQTISRLRREQLIEARAGLTVGPLISSKHTSSDRDIATTSVDQTIIDQIFEHVLWRIKKENVTQITSLLIKLVLDDGYRTGKLKVDSYDDVACCFENWRSNLLIKLYAFGVAPANDQKLVLSSTSSGDLTKWVANYIDGSEKRQNPDLIRKLATALRDKTKNCIFITNDIVDALKALETGSLRCAFVVDRLNRYETSETSIENFKTYVEPLIVKGKLFIMSSLDCVEFAPDPTSESCC